MRACIVELERLFKLETQTREGQVFFDSAKRKLVIPLYQRGYIWDDDKVLGLIGDICRRDKFVGNLILDEKASFYDIVDGQQRITTFVLTLVCIYNYYEGQPFEQAGINNLLRPINNTFSLINESIGDYLNVVGSRIELSIQESKDVYFQKERLSRVCRIIEEYLDGLGSQEAVSDFKEKLLNSKVLVLINDNDPIARSIEQVFLDINEKAALLEPEDIFKGYCFKNAMPESHSSLRDKWVKLRKCGSGYIQLGFDDLSEFLYVFLLTTRSKDINKKLYIQGKHVLDGKSTDQTFAVLDEMINFGESVLNFVNSLNHQDYRFVDLCPEAYAHRGTDDHLSLKAMCRQHLTPKGPQYYKVPMMCVVYALTHHEGIRKSVTYDRFRRILSDVYVYGVLFVLSGQRKSKEKIDTTVWEAIGTQDATIDSVYDASKELRKNKVNEFSLPSNLGSFELLSKVYSIMDSFDANKGFVKTIYSRDNHYNLEHFVGLDNAKGKVEWRHGNQITPITLDVELIKETKRRTINYLIINDDLNGSLRSYDIVTKIQMVKDWFENRDLPITMHVSIIIKHIEALSSYKRLLAMKEVNPTEDEIKTAYESFLEEYISEISQATLLENLRSAFQDSFKN